jgi:non-homologous end joining protein Ku
LLKLIERKAEGKEIVASDVEKPKATKAPDLMAALEESIAAVQGRKAGDGAKAKPKAKAKSSANKSPAKAKKAAPKKSTANGSRKAGKKSSSSRAKAKSK